MRFTGSTVLAESTCVLSRLSLRVRVTCPLLNTLPSFALAFDHYLTRRLALIEAWVDRNIYPFASQAAANIMLKFMYARLQFLSSHRK